jgi:RHH-type rel operon transcriptional repressor/antitoxin RelB
MITLRLDSKLEKNIDDFAHHLGISRSELIRKSIEEYLKKLDKPSAWESGKDFFGKYASGSNNVSEDRKTLFKEKVKAKRG